MVAEMLVSQAAELGNICRRRITFTTKQDRYVQTDAHLFDTCFVLQPDSGPTEETHHS
jgi:hypothetical protein